MKLTTRDAVASWLDALVEHHSVIAPCHVESELLYRQVTSSAQVVFDFQRTVLSAKSFFLPDTQVLFEIQKQGTEIGLTELEPWGATTHQDQVLFAVRPCDAQGLSVLDGLLLDRPPADSYYLQRRENTTLVGLACPRLWDDCFCTSMGSGPDDASGVDVMLYERGMEYWVVAVTEKGAALLDGLDAAETEQAAPASDASGERVPVLAPEAWETHFDDAFWSRLAERCLGCRACTYVCPTCRCFDVRDDITAAGPGYAHIQRLRAWDSCLGAGYRRIAGGHNPRPTTAQRLRNRYYCKFCYSPHAFGPVACVGCGRCIAACPVGIDITEVLADVGGLDVADGRGISHE
jgi:sulfhydrogenase subunit beta (sulfur reductase)